MEKCKTGAECVKNGTFNYVEYSQSKDFEEGWKMMDDFGFGGGGFDWNGNGSGDLFDDYMDYKVSGSDKSNAPYGSKHDVQMPERAHSEKNTGTIEEKGKLTTAEMISVAAAGLSGITLGIAIINVLPVLGTIFLGGVVAGVWGMLKG